MDALKLYNYGVVNDQKKKFALPPLKKSKITKKIITTTVKYICYKCNKTIDLKLSDNIKCTHCDNRVLRKEKHSEPQTYNSI